MDNYKTIIIEKKQNILTIKLNRPEVHNAINDVMINELYEAFTNLKDDQSVKVIVITGNGISFCSGADLNWLRSVMNYSYEQNYEESRKLAKLLYLIYQHPKPVVAKVNGVAIGGGVGLILASDIAVASENASFGLSEVRIGIVPAAIIQFLKERIGAAKTREYLITGERMNAVDAYKYGLINYSVPENELDKAVEEKLEKIVKNGPEAIATVKRMMNELEQLHYPEIVDYIAHTISRLRVSKEGQEGMHAFFEKREPEW